MFIQPCFIRKNTPELRKKLEELGYHYTWYNDGSGIYSYNNIAQVFTYKKELPKECIGCPADNEELFLALAALRDDSDYMQWFTDGEKWIQNKQNDIEVIRCGAGNPINFHKATVEELIEYFK